LVIHFLRLLVAGLGLCLGSAAALAQNAIPLSDFKSGPGNGLYSYASSTPATVMDLIHATAPRPPVLVQGQLLLPANTAADAKLPAVVLVHGSGGLYPELFSYWGKLLSEQGIVVLVIDVFGPRGVKSTAKNQSLVPFAADTADAFAALGMLASHPRINAQHIAVMGFSRGGITAVRSGVLSIIQGAAPAGLRFAAHVALYSGGCAGPLAVAARPGVFSPEPMLFVHGDADDYAAMSDCRLYAQRIAAAGTPTEFVVLPGAGHKFDMDNTQHVKLSANSKTKEGCPLEFDVLDDKTRDRRNGAVLSANQVKEIHRDLCADKGASVQGNPQAREVAGQAVIGFLNRVFKSLPAK
jgi:dienelactone hydrolase